MGKEAWCPAHSPGAGVCGSGVGPPLIGWSHGRLVNSLSYEMAALCLALVAWPTYYPTVEALAEMTDCRAKSSQRLDSFKFESQLIIQFMSSPSPVAARQTSMLPNERKRSSCMVYLVIATLKFFFLVLS